MYGDGVEQDAKALLEAVVAHNPAVGTGDSFAVNAQDVEQANLGWIRANMAMLWLLNNELVDRDEEAEALLGNAPGVSRHLYGTLFKLTQRGKDWFEAPGATATR